MGHGQRRARGRAIGRASTWGMGREELEEGREEELAHGTWGRRVRGRARGRAGTWGTGREELEEELARGALGEKI